MCDICGFIFCPSGCPSYEGVSAELGRPIAECCECGDYIYKNESFYEERGEFWCANCALDI